MAKNKSGEVNPFTGLPYSKRYHKLLEKRKKLPIWLHKDRILGALDKTTHVLIVAADSGSGKSTQIPQFVVEAGYAHGDRQIACTQPRRIVTTSISSRVAKEMDVMIGQEVGYSVQFEERTSPKTLMKYITDGMLLREALSDRFLEHYRVIILDEAHLRTLATDILVMYLKELLKTRNDLKLIIMCLKSAIKMFQEYFIDALVVEVPPNLVSMPIIYSQQSTRDYIQAVIDTILHIYETEPSGNILVFLTGEDDIASCSSRLAIMITDMGDKAGPVKIIPIHSMLSLEMQKEIYKCLPPPKKGGPAGRKILLSTDITESSMVIDDIVYIIDPGLTKQKVYNPQFCVESLLILPITKASATQRLGCIRRLGKCFRLYTLEYFNSSLQPEVSPEILRANLASTILVLKKLGVNDIFHADLIDYPSSNAINKAFETLICLGALDGEGNLTKLGELMSEFPLDPQMSKMIVTSPYFGCSNEILSIAAMLSVPYCFIRSIENPEAAEEAQAQFRHNNGDHLTLLNVYCEHKKHCGDLTWCKKNFLNHEALQAANNTRKQLASIMGKLKLELCSADLTSCDYDHNIRKAILSGYFMQVAWRGQTDHYLIAKHHHVVDLHPLCGLNSNPSCVMYNDFVLASRTFIRIVTEIRDEWLLEVAPHYYKVSIT